MGVVEVKTTGFNQDGTVVIHYQRSILVYKRGHEPQRRASAHKRRLLIWRRAIRRWIRWQVLRRRNRIA